MEFSEKLQHLRKQKGLTQEELAQALYVSRTAISKWESGRGYPSIDSLKAISRFFCVSIDDLLSGEEVLSLAQEEHARNRQRFLHTAFGLLDCGMALLWLLPLFRHAAGAALQAVPLYALYADRPYLAAVYFTAITAAVITGVTSLALHNRCSAYPAKRLNRLSLSFHAASVFLFILGQHPYAAVFALTLLMIKVWLLLRQR